MTGGGLVGDDLSTKCSPIECRSPIARMDFCWTATRARVEQAQFLDSLIAARHLTEPIILHLDVPMDALVGRMTSRRQSSCGRI